MKIKSILLCSIFTVFSCATAFSQEEKKNYTEAFELVEIWLEAQKDFYKLPGLTAIVIDDQEVLWSGAFGLANIEKKNKTDTSTI